MMYNLFRVLWMFLHLVLSVVHFIEYLWFNLRRKLGSKVKDEFILVSEHVKLLGKIPSHLAVIVGNEPISYRDLANITVWCLAAGISFISFYDHHGVLKQNEAELINALSKIRKGHLKNIVWGKKTVTHGLMKQNGTKNGLSSSQKIHVNILSLSDGKGALVELTKGLGHSVLSGQMKSSEISLGLINEKLQAELGVPDPELALYCGDTCSMFGFLPWQIRVTEFLQLHTHHKIQVNEFLLLLTKYGKCVQRFGK